MYICPICSKEYDKENQLVKHMSMCWKQKHPNHKSKDAPCAPTIVNKQDNSDIIDFLSMFERK